MLDGKFLNLRYRFFCGEVGLASETQSYAEGATFLLVEDDAIIAMMTEMSLADAGARDIVIAGSVAEAMLLAEDHLYDVAIFDRQLSDGISYPAAIVACRKGAAIIVATGSRIPDLPVELADAILLPKPYEAIHLERAVLKALSKRQMG